MEIEVNGRQVVTDNEGYLANLEDWSEDLANAIAARESLAMTPDHWEIVNFLRRGYEETGVVPNIRQLQKLLANEYGAEKADNFAARHIQTHVLHCNLTAVLFAQSACLQCGHRQLPVGFFGRRSRLRFVTRGSSRL